VLSQIVGFPANGQGEMAHIDKAQYPSGGRGNERGDKRYP
jgi:hypothetical protein